MPPFESLVKYDTPKAVKNLPKDKRPGGAGKVSHGGSNEASMPPPEDILSCILPPREWTQEGQLWVQYPSTAPSTRLDVLALQEDLDRQLEQRQALESGICPVREELYAQLFDELIRQVTVNCVERGLLLLRVRDDMHNTIAAYQTLYESSVAFGLRKALQAEAGKADLERQAATLEATVKDLERQVAEWKGRADAGERREAERREADAKKHKEEVAFLEGQVRQLKQQLDMMLAPKK